MDTAVTNRTTACLSGHARSAQVGKHKVSPPGTTDHPPDHLFTLARKWLKHSISDLENYSIIYNNSVFRH